MNHVVSLHLRHRIFWLASTSVSEGDDVTTFREKSEIVDTLFFGNNFKNLPEYTTSQNKISHLVFKKIG